MGSGGKRLARTQMAQNVVHTLAQSGKVFGHEGDTNVTLMAGRSLGQCRRQRGQACIGAQWLIQRGMQLIQLALQIGAIRSAQDAQLDRPSLRTQGCIQAPAGAVLLQHGVEIGSAKTEC